MKRSIFTVTALLFSIQSHAWVIDADFENGSLGQKANGSDGFTEAFSNTKYSNEQVRSGARAVKTTIQAGTNGFGDFGGIWSFPSALKQGDELWFRVWVYFPSGFDFDCGCPEGLKFMRTRTYTSNGKFDGSIDYQIESDGMVMSSGVKQNDFFNNHPWPYEDIRGIGGQNTTGTWHAYEHYTKFSSVSGQGVRRAWKDGKLIFEDKITATLNSSGSVAKNAYMWTFWNNDAPKTQSVYMDDIILTNERPSSVDSQGNPFIGIGNAEFSPSSQVTSPPKPPTVQ